MLNTDEFKDLQGELKVFGDDIDKVTRKAILLYKVLGKVNARLDEINTKCTFDWDKAAEDFKRIFKTA